MFGLLWKTPSCGVVLVKHHRPRDPDWRPGLRTGTVLQHLSPQTKVTRRLLTRDPIEPISIPSKYSTVVSRTLANIRSLISSYVKKNEGVCLRKLITINSFHGKTISFSSCKIKYRNPTNKGRHKLTFGSSIRSTGCWVFPSSFSQFTQTKVRDRHAPSTTNLFFCYHVICVLKKRITWKYKEFSNLWE